MQRKTGNAYIHKRLFPSLARLLFNGDIPTQVLRDQAGFKEASKLEFQYGFTVETTKYLVSLTEWFYDVSAHKRLTREYIDFLGSKHVE